MSTLLFRKFASRLRYAVMATGLLFLVSYSAKGQLTVNIGSDDGVNGTTDVPCPIQDYYYAGRSQYLYTEAELSAQGITPGAVISSIGWIVDATQNDAWNGEDCQTEGYTISLATTSITTLDLNSWEGGTSVFYGPTDYFYVANGSTGPSGTISFPGNFVYTGGNLLVEVCGGLSSGGYSINPQCHWTENLSFTASHNFRQDNTNGCGNTSVDDWSGNNNNRPVLVLEYTPGASCAGQPEAGNAVATDNTVCALTPFSISLSGANIAADMTFQWYSSPAGTGTFTPIGGATNPSYNTSITASTDYYCVLNCTISGLSDTSGTAAVTLNPATECYCTPEYSGGCNWDAVIENVTIENINNTSGDDCSVAPPGYSDFTNFSTDLMQGVNYNGSITCGTYGDFGVQSWIDFNDNGMFETSESVGIIFSEGWTGSSVTTALPINIPAAAQLGQHRLRVRMGNYYTGDEIDPCDEIYSGETEDYLVNIIPLPDCSGVTFPTAVAALANPSALCESGDVNLKLEDAMPLAANVTYQWQSSNTQTGGYTNLGAASSGPQYTTFANASKYYQCQVLCNGGVILTSDPVFVEAVVPSTPSTTDGQHCGPGVVTLSASAPSGTLYWYNDLVGFTPIAEGNSYTTPPLATTTTYYVSSGAYPSVDTFVGTGNSTQGWEISPFYAGYGDSWKHQYLIKAAELEAIGLQAGEIAEIGLDLVGTPTGTFENFSIAMDMTTTNSLSDFTAGLPVVYTNAAYSPTAGANMFPLTTPLVWDGTSNIIVQTCFYDQSGSSVTSNVRFDNISGYTCHMYGYSDAADACDVPDWGPYTYNGRPKFFMRQPACESDRVEATAFIRDTPVVDLGPDESLCGDADQSLTLDAGNAGGTYLWDDQSTGQTRTVTQSGTYFVTVTNQYGCVSSDTTTKQILLSPSVHLGNDTTVCEGVTLQIDAGSDGETYYWSTGSTDQVISVDETGSYFVIVTNDVGCTIVDTINVTVSGELPSIDAILVESIAPYTFNFSVYNPQGAVGQYIWDFGDNTPVSNAIAPTHTYATVGNYQVTLTLNTAECGLLVYTTSVHILGLNDIKVDDALLSVYPNPANDVLIIENKGDFKMREVVLTNVLGQVVTKEKMDSNRKYTLDVSSYPSGLYTLMISTDKGTVIRKVEVLR